MGRETAVGFGNRKNKLKSKLQIIMCLLLNLAMLLLKSLLDKVLYFCGVK